MKKFLNSLLSPFEYKNFILLVLFFFLSTSAELYFCLQQSDFKAGLLNLIHGFVFSYAITLFGASLKEGKARKIIVALISVLLCISCFVDWVCLVEFHSDFSGDFISAILGTDFSESQEFIGLHWKGICISSSILGLLIVLYFFLVKKNFKIWNPLGWILLSSLLPMLAVFFMVPKASKRIITEKSFEGKFISFISYARNIPPAIPDNCDNLQIKFDYSDLPENICLIFGESHCKKQCQFYGYDKETMPLTQRLVDSNVVYVFNNVHSAAISTVESFRAMMSTYKPEFGEKDKYWERPSIIHVMREAGYEVTWISNQSKRGMFDNLIGNYAELSDTVFFIGDKYAGLRRTTKDGEIIPILRDIKRIKTGKNFSFFT